nr:hypothetical protein [Verrucomicrobium spinosum]
MARHLQGARADRGVASAEITPAPCDVALGSFQVLTGMAEQDFVVSGRPGSDGRHRFGQARSGECPGHRLVALGRLRVPTSGVMLCADGIKYESGGKGSHASWEQAGVPVSMQDARSAACIPARPEP